MPRFSCLRSECYLYLETFQWLRHKLCSCVLNLLNSVLKKRLPTTRTSFDYSVYTEEMPLWLLSGLSILNALISLQWRRRINLHYFIHVYDVMSFVDIESHFIMRSAHTHSSFTSNFRLCPLLVNSYHHHLHLSQSGHLRPHPRPTKTRGAKESKPQT